MYVCHCEVVSDQEIRGAIEAGARDVASVSSVCGAGSVCGGCHPSIEELLADAAAAICDPRTLRTQQVLRRRRRPAAVTAEAMAS